MAIPFILHRHVSKGTQKQPHTAAAHVRYISRQSATVYRYAERMPVNWHAAQRFLCEREERIRKDGRVIDKLTISLPREMTMDQAVDTVRKFGFHLSLGRAPFYFTIQNWGEQNPHCHFIFVDADIETGRRVFKTTDRNSTERIKDLWEKVCNSELQALGIDASISFSEAAELKAAKLEAERYEADQKAEPEQTRPPADEMPLDAPTQELPEPDEEPIPAEEETDAEDAPEGEDDMALTRAQRFNHARRDLNELRILKDKRQEVNRLRTEYAYWREEARTSREKAELAKGAHEDAIARTGTAGATYEKTHFMGFRRGVNLDFGLFKIRSKGIDRAIQAEAEYEKATYAQALRAADFREANNYANNTIVKVSELEEKVRGIDARVNEIEHSIDLHERINGFESDLEAAEGFFNDTIGKYLKGFSPNDIIDAYENDEITITDAKMFLAEMGHPELVNWIEAQQEEQAVKH
ncbi:hypothetical protein [Bradyrhizobium sp. LB5.2]|uniref:hypothetical protein n=1 Tax=Bradyrhizobium sp. LB5.2 TaxID=3156329 RepID=UPI0033960AB1